MKTVAALLAALVLTLVLSAPADAKWCPCCRHDRHDAHAWWHHSHHRFYPELPPVTPRNGPHYTSVWNWHGSAGPGLVSSPPLAPARPFHWHSWSHYDEPEMGSPRYAALPNP